ncbi:MAG: SDR family NAD(P)-dependent oxidoreductase [Anaerolineae bacterium]|nr:SDR family NAD(P)-dependent oxidoreductase [Anaerolineae bacterium]
MKELDKNKFGPWAIITGASSGIGKEFARQVAASGIHVVLVARRLPLLEAWGEELAKTYGVQYRAVHADLSQPDFMDRLKHATQDLEIGLLVSNAGTGIPGEFLSIPEELLLNIVQLNAISHMRLVHYYGRPLIHRGYGGIVLVSAMGALDGIPYMANDAATKAYVTSLGQGLHVEFAQAGVHTTVVIPGPTDTPIIEKFGLDAVKLPLKPMPVEQCVAEGLAALEANHATHLTGRLNRIMMGLIPASITRKLNGKMLSSGLINGQPRLAHLA